MTKKTQSFGVEGLNDMIARREKARRKKAHTRAYGMQPMSEDTQETKAMMVDRFHKACSDRDRVDQYLQALHEETKPLPPRGHADHVIRQGQASKAEKLDPVYGIGCLPKTNEDRALKKYGAAMLKEAGLVYQVIWLPADVSVCKRRRMEEDGSASLWHPYEKPAWMKDGHAYDVDG